MDAEANSAGVDSELSMEARDRASLNTWLEGLKPSSARWRDSIDWLASLFDEEEVGHALRE